MIQYIVKYENYVIPTPLICLSIICSYRQLPNVVAGILKPMVLCRKLCESTKYACLED